MTEESDSLELFELTRVASAAKICLSTFNGIPGHQTVALVLESGDVLFYHNPPAGDTPVVRCVPWFEDPQKRIESATFDPASGNWLLVVCHDGSLYLVPTQLPSNLDTRDCDWSVDDITALPPICGVKMADLCPTAVAWWDRTLTDGRCQIIVIVGGSRGGIVLAMLRTGCVVGRTAVEGSVTNIQVCKDDTLLDNPPVFLLITNEHNIQWKLVLEDREMGYSWPLPSEPSRAESNTSLISVVGSEESVVRPSMTSFPLARARLQGLKQLSVEKLATLRQKLSESRNRGVTTSVISAKRRGSSSSEESVSRQRSSVSSDSESLSGAAILPKLELLNETSLYLQTARGKPVIVGHYAPAHIVTVYGVGLNLSPISIHRLPGPCGLVRLTDWLLYVTDLGCRQLSVVSYRMSQCRIDSDKQILNSEVNPDSLLQQFFFQDGEEIQALYRITPNLKDQNEKFFGRLEEETTNRKKTYKSNRSSGLAEQSPLDQCAVVTNKAVYKVVMRKSPREVVFACVMNPNKLERAERLCHMFGLDLQQLLETAAEKQLEAGQLDSAVTLYKLARCRPVKSVLHMASAGFTQQLLAMTTGLLQTSQPLSQTESLHLANLSVLTFTEQCLRAKSSDNIMTQFRGLLRDNHHYDEVLAVSVVGQSGLCTVLEYLCDQRGLATHVLDVLARVINCQHTPTLNCELCEGFWECMSNTNLAQALVVNPDFAKLHMGFVKSRLSAFSPFILQRFANLYDPSQPAVRPVLKRLLDESSNKTSQAKTDKGDSQFPLSDWLTSYLLVCLYLGHCRPGGSSRYSPDLMVDLPSHHSDSDQSTKEPVSLSPVTVSGGYTHVGLVRNGQLYMWGYTVNGCLGVGPTLSQTLQPLPLPLFPALGVQVVSVACGKLHTLALTTNGVYAWGSSRYGQLGVGPTSQSSEPRLVEGLYDQNIVAVVAGQYHSLALTAAGRVYSWGWGVHGQLGHGNVEDCCYPALIEALSSEVIVSCSGGHAHTLMLSSSGRVWACGSSVFGQLGTGSNLKSSRPVQVFGLPEKIISISTSYFHNLALAVSNRLYSWGSSPQVLRLQAQAQKKARFQLQQQQHQQAASASVITKDIRGVTDDQVPEPDLDTSDVSEGDADGGKSKLHFKLAPTSRFVTLNSEMVVSPSTEFKGLPTGRATSEPTTNVNNSTPAPPGVLVGVDDGLAHLSPTLVDTSHVEGKITKISCGCHHSTLLTDTGQIYTWGRNLDAQLGNGARTKEAVHPTHIAVGNGTSEIVTVECGGDFTLAIEASGKVWGWGSNQVGQLGREPIEDATKAGLEGRLLMLKTSKRVIKLPHGALNTVETPKEIPSLPSLQIAFQSHPTESDSLKLLARLSTFDNPPHSAKTLHYALSYFHGHYDTAKFREKCIELGDYQTASKLAMLDKQFDMAMSYQLQAAMASSETNHKPPSSVTSSQPSVLERASKSVVSTEVIVPTLETSLTINTSSAKKIGISRTRSNTQSTEDAENIAEPTKPEKPEEVEEKSTSEIHMFTFQGGAEEMSVRSQDTLCSKSDLLESRCDTPDTLASCDEFATKSAEVFDSPVKQCAKRKSDSESLTYETIVNNHIKELELQTANGEDVSHNSALIEDLVNIVEFYIDLCEQGPQTSLKALLKQGLEFWTDHKLPVCRLEALLLSHWSLVSYPLGLLLLGNDSEVSVDAQQMLSNLSTDFSLQLCSAMVNHVSVSDKDNSVPEVMELLSGLSWSEQTSASLASEPLSLDQIISQISYNSVPEVMELLSGLSWSEQTSASLASEPLSLDQIISQISYNSVPEVMELLSGLSWSEQTSASLASEPLSLDQIISQISYQQPAQSYIDIDFTVSDIVICPQTTVCQK
ncbi:uncharacterized protein LOC128995726 [Macrosteles quadrilineatus]|uniref:uncharacterized protein LOC128995726 n=1 Tax=Macrosteles quadrilineatus TaxID=74068 RepID=UPI0023E0D9B6|nr:uncharacterized protein LOC128995726 [Macrosteles quadrilineatus]